MRALAKDKCPSLRQWIEQTLLKEDVLEGAPMMSAHKFTEDEKNAVAAKIAKHGEKCKYEFDPPFVICARRSVSGSPRFTSPGEALTKN